MLVAAMQGCNSSDMAQGERDYAQFLASPEIELILFHTMSDELKARRDDRFRRAAARRCSRTGATGARSAPPGQRWHDDPDGFIALGPLAAVAARQDAGLPVGLTSDYLPRSATDRSPQVAPKAASA